jgi:beta-lactamase class A
MKPFFLTLCVLVLSGFASAQLDLPPEISLPELNHFQPLPKEDALFSASIAGIVELAGLDEPCPAERNPDGWEEFSSICVVDLSDPTSPTVAGWRADNFVYPASAYKMYVLGEAIRQHLEGEFQLDDILTVKEHNVRGGSRLEAGQQVSISEVLRLMSAYSDNTAANEAIDLVDRQRASAMLRALGCEGSDITRKYLSRDLEDEGYSDVVGTTTSALHFATFLWAVESGAIGGGEGRGLIKSYLGHIQTNKERFRKGLSESATIYSKTGTWNTFSAEVGLVEDGELRYIMCVLAPYPGDVAAPKMAQFSKGIHRLMRERLLGGVGSSPD